MITGNKGEWSEIYALFRLLGDKRIFLGDEDIQRLKGLVYPIISILRTEKGTDYVYSVQDEIIIISGNTEILKIPVEEFKNNALILLSAIKRNKGTFSVPEIENFMRNINCIALKADSSTKTDITIIVHDPRTNQQPTLGFSIKSQLGSPSTLLNAGKTTNFIFEILGAQLTKNDINEINSINSGSKIKARIARIQEKGGKLVFTNNENRIFSNNLAMIDSRLPEILAKIIFDFYSSKRSSIKCLVAYVAKKNPIHYDISDGHKFYEYKIKRFLTDIALGMMPSRVWTGMYDATGGYLIIKQDGEIICYHIYNRNEFENYLFNNTKLETASSSKHGFGKIYEIDSKTYINLNLQIRFV